MNETVPDPIPKSYLRKAAIPFLFAVAAVVLTWPLAWSPGLSLSVRDDYYLSLWNIWWFKVSLFGTGFMDSGSALYWTDYLHYPLGVSLTRNVISPVNAFTGAIASGVLDLHTAAEWLHLIHFALGGGFCFLFVRSVTGSSRGAVLAGFFYAYSPFSFYYLPQMNVSTMEFLPLAAFFLVRTYRGGGVGNYLGIAASAALIAAGSLYYLIYIALLGLLLMICGKGVEPDVGFAVGGRRLLKAAFMALCAVLLVVWPLLSESLSSGMDNRNFDLVEHQVNRSNDLLGFLWVGGPERVILAWPVLLGYSSLLLILAGLRLKWKQLFWIAAALFFLVLSLGPVLHVGGSSTGVPLPYAGFSEIPILWMLRKPDRFVVMVLLCAGVSLGWSFKNLEVRWASTRARNLLVWFCGLILVAERMAIPLATFDDPMPACLQELARDKGIHSLVDIPHMGGHASDARSNYLQTVHEKKIPQGYVVELALTGEHFRACAPWSQAQDRLVEGDARPLVALAEQRKIDAILIRKTLWVPRKSVLPQNEIVWAPFVFVHDPLVLIRQQGAWFVSRAPETLLSTEREALTALVGPPEFEDDEIMVFDRR
ncbi:MAG: hypothetical protein ABIK28_25815 [Planctomycetota bacterium]